LSDRPEQETGIMLPANWQKNSSGFTLRMPNALPFFQYCHRVLMMFHHPAWPQLREAITVQSFLTCKTQREPNRPSTSPTFRGDLTITIRASNIRATELNRMIFTGLTYQRIALATASIKPVPKTQIKQPDNQSDHPNFQQQI